MEAFSGRVMWTQCPECEMEKIEKQEREKREREERERQGRIKQMLEVSGIPKRFISKDITGMKADSEPEKKAIRAILNYEKAVVSGSPASLILCGRPGTGKTHIGCAIVKAVISSDKAAKIINVSSLMRKVKATYRKDCEYTENDVFEFYGDLPFLVIDEVGVQFGSETEKLIFYEIINARYNNELPTVLISNLTQDELLGFVGERVMDRFKEDGGAVIAFDWESHRG